MYGKRQTGGARPAEDLRPMEVLVSSRLEGQRTHPSADSSVWTEGRLPSLPCFAPWQSGEEFRLTMEQFLKHEISLRKREEQAQGGESWGESPVGFIGTVGDFSQEGGS